MLTFFFNYHEEQKNKLTAKNKNNIETKKSKKNPLLILFAHLDLVSVKIIPHSYTCLRLPFDRFIAAYWMV